MRNAFPKTRRQNEIDSALAALLREHGFAVRGGYLVALAIKGFTADATWWRTTSLFSAAERLIPIIHDAKYLERFQAITAETK